MRKALEKLRDHWRTLPNPVGDPEVRDAYQACAGDVNHLLQSCDFDIAHQQFELGVALSRVLTLTGNTTLTFIGGDDQSTIYSMDADSGMVFADGKTEVEALQNLGDKIQGKRQ